MGTVVTEPVILTMKVTALSLMLQLLLGLPLGLLISGKKTFFRTLLDFIITLPMIFPPIALGFFLLIILGRNGIIGGFLAHVFDLKIIFTFWGILTATFLVGLPFMVKSVQASREQFDNSLVEAAATLGKNKWCILIQIILPAISNGIITGLLLSCGRSLGEVGISLMLGGNIIGRTETLSLAIYNAVFEGNFHKAMELSLMLSAIAIVVLIGLNWTKKEKKSRYKKQHE
jgi:molybdate transport system permease protein